MKLIRGIGSSVLCVLGSALLSLPVTAEPPAVPRKGVPARPIVNAAKLKPVPPRLQTTGPCGIGQTQCFRSGGKVPPRIPEGALDNARPKVCTFNGDPKWSCGKCTPCVLYKTMGAFCGPKGCDYQKCMPNFADLDGNRANGCETWVPTRKPVPPRPPAMPEKACRSDGDCGAPSPDIRCVPRRPGSAAGTCRWWPCRPSTADCNYLPYSGIVPEGAPRCLNDTTSDGHGCGYWYPSCGPFRVPSDIGLCHSDDSVVDADGDGAPSEVLLREPSGASNGNDCDDGDPARFPGNTEVCDAFGHDEDCNPATNGAPDADRDGQTDGACCNELANGKKSCGGDCDDHNPGLALAGKRCQADGQMQICTLDTSGGGQVASWVTRPCGTGSVCVPQPDGTGVCQLR